MGVTIKPSDLQYRYAKKKEKRGDPKFRGKSDPHPFDRDDLFEVTAMFGAVMDELGSREGAVLHRMEEVLNNDIPRCIATRAEVFDCLVGSMREWMSG